MFLKEKNVNMWGGFMSRDRGRRQYIANTLMKIKGYITFVN